MTPPASFTPSETTNPAHPQCPTEMTASAHIDKHEPRCEASTAAHVACPVCQRKMIRIWRRPSDRLLSLFTPLHRYRCNFHDCRWEGNIRQPRSQRKTAGRPSGSQIDAHERSVPPAFIVYMVVVLIGVVTVFAAAYSDWWSTGDSLVSAPPWSVYDGIGESEAGLTSTLANDPSVNRTTGR